LPKTANYFSLSIFGGNFIYQNDFLSGRFAVVSLQFDFGYNNMHTANRLLTTDY